MKPAVAATPGAGGGAKIFRFLARPQLMVAAGFVLVLGAGLLFMQTSARKAAPPMAASRAEEENAPVAAATATAAASAVAMNDPPPPPAAAAPAVATPPSELGAAAASAATRAVGGKAQTQDPQFLAAKKLYDGGRFAEALPKFEALSPTHPEAELYVARCLVRTRGCSVAAARFDSAATRNAGTESGSRASLEGARCYGSMGEAQAARSRYNSLTEDAFVAPEAKDELAGLDGDGKNRDMRKSAPAPAAPAPRPVATAGTPVPAQHAAPKAVTKPARPAARPAAEPTAPANALE
jgi:hypothetical protein